MSTYRVRKIDRAITIGDVSNLEAWSLAETAPVQIFPWTTHDSYPETSARVLYCDASLYLFFECREKYLFARQMEHQGPVCRDNCVEFFFRPHDTGTGPYFNFEFNCLGTMLVACGTGRQERKFAPAHALESIRLRAPFSEPVDLQDETTKSWSLEVAIPFELLAECGGVTPPGPGTVWAGNFYKCSEDSKDPHWACWNPVQTEKPDFHRPEFFGKLLFE